MKNKQSSKPAVTKEAPAAIVLYDGCYSDGSNCETFPACNHEAKKPPQGGR